MSDKNIYDALFDKFADDIDFKAEYLILKITEQISVALEEKKIRRVDLAERLNSSKAAITKMLDGTANFTLKRLIRISEAIEKELVINFIDRETKVNFNNPVSTLEDTTISTSGKGLINTTKCDNLKTESELKPEAA